MTVLRAIRVVLTGPESTAKTALTLHLAETFGWPHALEYARIHLETHGSRYDLPMLSDLARLHLAYQRRQVPPDAPVGVLDTDLVNYRIWCEEAFGTCPGDILDALSRETEHRYLLCAPDIPWAFDPLREHPHDRERLFDRHREAIEALGRPYRVITGTGEARLRAAVDAARDLMAGTGIIPPEPGPA